MPDRVQLFIERVLFMADDHFSGAAATECGSRSDQAKIFEDLIGTLEAAAPERLRTGECVFFDPDKETLELRQGLIPVLQRAAGGAEPDKDITHAIWLEFAAMQIEIPNPRDDEAKAHQVIDRARDANIEGSPGKTEWQRFIRRWDGARGAAGRLLTVLVPERNGSKSRMMELEKALHEPGVADRFRSRDYFDVRRIHRAFCRIFGLPLDIYEPLLEEAWKRTIARSRVPLPSDLDDSAALGGQ